MKLSHVAASAALLAGTLAISGTARAATTCASSISYTGSIVTCSVGTSGLYALVAYGAQGGAADGFGVSGGLGAQIGGDFNFLAGDLLTIAVGGMGHYNGNLGGGGGGGGSFVVGADGLPLLIAGGGGGAGAYSGGLPGLVDGQGGGGAGGANGTGGGGGDSLGSVLNSGGGGGGGFRGRGGDGQDNSLSGGLGYPYLGGGGSDWAGAPGGFGGGGGGGAGGEGRDLGGGGGGGGYSGGSGGAGSAGGGGGGGGSFNASIPGASTNYTGVNGGNGLVTLRLIREAVAPVPEPGTWTLMIGGFGLAGAALRRRRAILRRNATADLDAPPA